jgi:hypothetical protein
VLVWLKGTEVAGKNFYDVNTGILVKAEGGPDTGSIYSLSKELLKTNIRLKK